MNNVLDRQRRRVDLTAPPSAALAEVCPRTPAGTGPAVSAGHSVCAVHWHRPGRPAPRNGLRLLSLTCWRRPRRGSKPGGDPVGTMPAHPYWCGRSRLRADQPAAANTYKVRSAWVQVTDSQVLSYGTTMSCMDRKLEANTRLAFMSHASNGIQSDKP